GTDWYEGQLVARRNQERVLPSDGQLVAPAVRDDEDWAGDREVRRFLQQIDGGLEDCPSASSDIPPVDERFGSDKAPIRRRGVPAERPRGAPPASRRGLPR